MFRLLALFTAAAAQAGTGTFGIRVVDEASGRGIPLATLRMVNEVAYVTDSAGWAAVDEQGLAGREVFFHLSSPGYERAADGFGYRGVKLRVEPGGRAEVKLRRTQPAERVARLTGGGIHRDSALLGLPASAESGIFGQDSVQAVRYRGSYFFLWGDTNVPGYPLGNFYVTAATLPSDAAPERGPSFSVK